MTLYTGYTLYDYQKEFISTTDTGDLVLSHRRKSGKEIVSKLADEAWKEYQELREYISLRQRGYMK